MDVMLWVLLAGAGVGAGALWYSWKRRQSTKK